MTRYLLFIISFISILFISSMAADTTNKTKSYLALGDSYTIGEGVSVSESWPYLLSKRLSASGIPVQEPKVIAKTGWRTDNLITAISEADFSHKYDLVSVLIGVNNQFQGKSLESYKKDLREILNRAVELCETGKSRVFVLSIPDYGSTPFGKLERESIGKEIDEWNIACKTICDEFEIPFFDITEISKNAAKDKGLTTKDNLHPSGKMYALWVDEIVFSVSAMLKD